MINILLQAQDGTEAADEIEMDVRRELELG